MKQFDKEIPSWCPKGFTLFQHHRAINLHFMKKGYDFFKYNGRTSTKVETYNISPFKWHYATAEADLIKMGRDLVYPLYLLVTKNKYRYVPITRPTVQQLCRLTHANEDLIFFNVMNDFKVIYEKFGCIPDNLNENSLLHPFIYDIYKANKFCPETLLCYDMFITSFLDPNASKDKIFWPAFCEEMELLRGFVSHLIDENDFKHGLLNITQPELA